MDKKKLLKVVILLLNAGVLLSTYLYISKVLNTSVICPTNGCEIVDSSPYSYLLGLPVSLWGLVYYLGMFTLAIIWFKKESDIVKKLFFLGTVWGVLFTIYLRFVEIFKIGAFCVWCWGSVVIIVALAYYSWRLYKADSQGYNSSDENKKVSN